MDFFHLPYRHRFLAGMKDLLSPFSTPESVRRIKTCQLWSHLYLFGLQLNCMIELKQTDQPPNNPISSKGCFPLTFSGGSGRVQTSKRELPLPSCRCFVSRTGPCSASLFSIKKKVNGAIKSSSSDKNDVAFNPCPAPL